MKRLEMAPRPGRPEKYVTRLLHDESSVRVIAFRLEPGQVVPAHTSPSTVLVTVLEGAGTFRGGSGESERLQAGQSAVYAPGESHAIAAEDGPLAFLAVITPRPL